MHFFSGTFIALQDCVNNYLVQCLVSNIKFVFLMSLYMYVHHNMIMYVLMYLCQKMLLKSFRVAGDEKMTNQMPNSIFHKPIINWVSVWIGNVLIIFYIYFVLQWSTVVLEIQKKTIFYRLHFMHKKLYRSTTHAF